MQNADERPVLAQPQKRVSMAKEGELPETQPKDAYFCEMPANPCAIVMFGASGDLARRKLLPALFDLAAHSCLAPRFQLLGFARTEMSDEKFRDDIAQALRADKSLQPMDEKMLSEFLRHLHYFRGDYSDADAYQRLEKRLGELDREAGLGGNRLFYLSTPPEVYRQVIENLGQAGLSRTKDGQSWARVVVEKPFGRDEESARALNRTVLSAFDESQVYRIDHYLGKETVQNLLVFRFGNGIFEPLWNRNYISSVQITAAETLGVEKRAAFYEKAGLVRDMIQSHLLLLTSLVALEPPAVFDATSVRNEKIKVLQSIRPFNAETAARDVVRGQYGPGTVQGKAVPGYRQEPGVNPQSATETFAALKLYVDNWRWEGVPFYLRSGKRMAQPATQIGIQFREAPHHVFRGEDTKPNWLVLNIQPNEGISLSFGAKALGSEMKIRPVSMDFRYRSALGEAARNAYSTLINDCLRGDPTLFDRADSVEAAWHLVDPILQAWKEEPAADFPNYPAGSWGPQAAQDLLGRDGFRWEE
jgi:glucose-6-phosphate 1-dehydrogenase